MGEAAGYSEPQLVTEGEFAGWSTWIHGDEPFELAVGPFYLKDGPDGRVQCAARAERRHTNGAGIIHGGYLMTFADFALFAIARKLLDSPAVTVNFHADFVGMVAPGERIIATGDVVQATKSMVFVRLVATQAGRAVLSATGTLKKIRPRGV